MKLPAALLLVFWSAAAATAAAHPARQPVEHFSSPPINGQRAPFSSAVRVGDVLYLSGQIGVGSDGKLPQGFEAQAKQTMDNISAILKRAGVGYDRLFKCTVMLDNIADWPAFNKTYVTYFPDGKFPPRSAFGGDGLTLGALLEVECIAYAGER